MKKLLFFSALLFVLFATPARAGVPCSLPFNLQNGQPADATQVMANYNALVTCLSNAAAAGVNSDITALTGLTTPIPPGLGGTQTFVATAPSTGSNNAIIVANTQPLGFVLTQGYTVVFIAGFSNNNLTTLQVGSSAAMPVFRRTEIGPVPAVGSEIVAGSWVAATYDGTQFQLTVSSESHVPIGTVIDNVLPIADPGFVLMLGQCLATNGIYNTLWKKAGSPGNGPCASGQFQMIDGRGRYAAQIDSGGSNNITVAGGNFDGTQINALGGAQNHTQTIAELPVHTPSGTIGGTQNLTGIITGPGGVNAAGAAGFTVNNPTTVAVFGANFSFTGNSIGGGSPFSILPPTNMVSREVKY